MRVVVSLVVLLAAAGVGFAYVQQTSPAWYERMRYPLSYDHIVVGHAKNYDLDPALVAAVIYRELHEADRARGRARVGDLSPHWRAPISRA